LLQKELNWLYITIVKVPGAESEKTLAEVQALGAEAFLFQGDLTKVDNIAKFFDETISRFGGVILRSIRRNGTEKAIFRNYRSRI
jgi:hypothetical protein